MPATLEDRSRVLFREQLACTTKKFSVVTEEWLNERLRQWIPDMIRPIILTLPVKPQFASPSPKHAYFELSVMEDVHGLIFPLTGQAAYFYDDHDDLGINPLRMNAFLKNAFQEKGWMPWYFGPQVSYEEIFRKMLG